jgi:ferredoxin
MFSDTLSYIHLFLGTVSFFVFLLAALVFFLEKASTAMKRSLFLASIVPLPYLIIAFVRSFPYRTEIGFILLFLTGISILILFFPEMRKSTGWTDFPETRIDERDTLFSRRLLKKGTSRYADYYAANPEKKSIDDKIRTKPGLLKKNTVYYHPHTFAAAEASFTAVKRLHKDLDKKPLHSKTVIDPERQAAFIKQLALKLGATSVGITRLSNYHFYSHIGRGEHYGKPVDTNHTHAIAITVEMDTDFIDCAPRGPTVLESARQYMNSATIAVQISEYVKQLGYSARAHIDGNYRVICPLVARDAGLGEIGRMGLLMTPRHGPRVRIAVVTTELALTTDPCRNDALVVDFCTLCIKCAVNCPAHAIPNRNPILIDGVRRWQIDSEKCFNYWCTAGTDCGQCIRVCPYAHPDQFLHNFIRIGIKQSRNFRRIAVLLDDLFYGRHPAASKTPDWMLSLNKGTTREY